MKMQSRYRFLQIGVRMLVNAEALNMVESIGNVTRHRTLPVVVPRAPGHYVIKWVPAISGESLAHRYQLEIVELARQSQCKDRLDYWSEQGEFLKHFDLQFYKQQCAGQQYPKPKQWECNLANQYGGQKSLKLNQIIDIDKRIVENSVVEDIAGYLVTEGPTRRTSRVWFSYAIPTMDALDQSQIDHQMHVRGALKAEQLGIQEGIQVPYYVQVGSVLYGFSVRLDVDGVGRYTYEDGYVQDKQCDLAARRCIAIHALRPIIEGDWGAKRSRFNPHAQPEVAVAILSTKPFPMPPPTLKFNDLIGELRNRLSAYKKLNGFEAQAVVYSPETEQGRKASDEVTQAISGAGISVEKTNNPVDFVEKIARTLGLECRFATTQ